MNYISSLYKINALPNILVDPESEDTRIIVHGHQKPEDITERINELCLDEVMVLMGVLKAEKMVFQKIIEMPETAEYPDFHDRNAAQIGYQQDNVLHKLLKKRFEILSNQLLTKKSD